MSWTVTDIIEKGRENFRLWHTRGITRFRSWEHCYFTFAKYRKQKEKGERLTDKDFDYLSLHLAFYLASWGMYRGSCFVLHKDYKIHRPVVEALFEKDYTGLWAIKSEDYLKNENRIDTVIGLSNRLKNYYEPIRSEVYESLEKSNNAPEKGVSDTLITKVLLGTLGCVPAYDRFFKSGVIKAKIPSGTGTFNSNSILALSEYYAVNRDDFGKLITFIYEKQRMKYPQMKIVDMCFWQIGYEEEKKEKSKKR
jgi:hypothetical protein